MIASSLKELNNTKAKVAQLEQALAKELASLPSAYGFESLKSFVAALKAAAGGKVRGAARPKKPAARKVRKRAKITDAVRAKVKKLVEAGKTGSSIARAAGISLPSVQNIKKALGLVKRSKKRQVKPKAHRLPVKRKAATKARKRRAAPKKPAVIAPKPVQVVAEPAPAPAV